MLDFGAGFCFNGRLVERPRGCERRRMMKTVFALTGGALVWAASTAQADTFIENFDAGPANVGAWTYGITPTYPTTGGNPGKYQRTQNIDTFAPQPRTSGAASIFTGNYREANVTSVGLVLITFAVDFSAEERPLSVILVSNNGTPANTNDDWGAYHIGPDNIPIPGQGWLSYDFEIPSQSTSLPEGWSFIQFGSGSPPNPDWSNLITNVSQLRYFYGNPEFFFIFQNWTVGIDNARITTEPAQIPGDADGNGAVNVDDLLIVINDWGRCEVGQTCLGDVDGNGSVDVNDLLLVINNWSS
jgi:hypothetical protein